MEKRKLGNRQYIQSSINCTTQVFKVSKVGNTRVMIERIDKVFIRPIVICYIPLFLITYLITNFFFFDGALEVRQMFFYINYFAYLNEVQELRLFGEIPFKTIFISPALFLIRWIITGKTYQK